MRDTWQLVACICEERNAAVATDWTCPNCVRLIDGTERVSAIGDVKVRVIPAQGGEECRITDECLQRVIDRVRQGEFEIDGDLVIDLLLPSFPQKSKTVFANAEEFRQSFTMTLLVIKDRDQNWSIKNIAATYGVARSTFYKAAKQFNVNPQEFVEEFLWSMMKKD